MSINIQAKTNYSFLFSGLSSTASNAAYLPGNFVCHFFGKRVDEKAEIW